MQSFHVFIVSNKLLTTVISVILFLVTSFNVTSIYLTIISHLSQPSSRTQVVINFTETRRVNRKCNPVPEKLCSLVIPLFPSTDNSSRKLFEIRQNRLLQMHNDFSTGGLWHPKNCVPLHRVAIIIPFRNRTIHLITLLNFLIPILKRQEILFQIFVVEQVGQNVFNKGRLMNIGYKYIKERSTDFQCFIFQDVDLIPEDDRNMYTCGLMPKHMSPSVDQLEYLLPYEELVGGVLALRREHFEKANGYSNSYWGWGGEDDDFYYRLTNANFIIERPPTQIGRYKMLAHHARRSTEPDNLRILSNVNQTYKSDGLSQIMETNCSIALVEDKKLYTHIFVEIGQKSAKSTNESSDSAPNTDIEKTKTTFPIRLNLRWRIRSQKLSIPIE